MFIAPGAGGRAVWSPGRTIPRAAARAAIGTTFTAGSAWSTTLAARRMQLFQLLQLVGRQDFFQFGPHFLF